MPSIVLHVLYIFFQSTHNNSNEVVGIHFHSSFVEEEMEAQQEFVLPKVQLDWNLAPPNSKPLPLTPLLFCHLIGVELNTFRTRGD